MEGMCMPSRAQTMAAILVALLIMMLAANPASAHTGFESSDPADGDVVDESVSEISLTFSGEATPSGEGFVVLDPSGTIRQPDEISSTDNLTWVLRFNEPLAGGVVGVRWMVAAPDAHPIDGSFSFTITAQPNAVEPEPLTEGTPGQDSSIDDSTSSPEVTGADDPASAAGADDGDPGTTGQPDSTAGASTADDAGVDLDSFLETDGDDPAGVATIAAVARILGIIGAVLVIGGAAFAAFGLRGDPSDVHNVLHWVRRGGVLLIIGAIGRATATIITLGGDWSSVTSPGDISDALWSSTGLAIGLRAVGGFLAASRIGFATTNASAAGDPVVAVRQLATVGAGHSTFPAADREPDEPFVYDHDQVWDHRLAIGGLIGVVLVSVSFMFDGHTASEGPRWLHALANVTHVTTASVWAGGVAMLALTMYRRQANDRPTQALQLAMRFSVVATIALVAAGLAGIALSVVVLDSVSEIWSTPWGQLLALKVALVTAAAVGGAYNHRIVVPALDQNPDDQSTIDRFRSVVTFEAVALVAVAIVTTFLIAASSS